MTPITTLSAIATPSTAHAQDVGADVHLARSTVVTAIGFGVVAVAPVFTLRRPRRMDIPSTLRVVE
jgi:putative ABC transport system permease protein